MYNSLFRYNAEGTYSFLEKQNTEKKTPVELRKPKYSSFTDRHCFNLLHGSTWQIPQSVPNNFI